MLPRYLWSVVLPLLEDLDSPRSLTVKLLIEHGELDQLVNLKVDPAQHLTPGSFYRDVVATELLRKCRDLETGIDTRAAALRTFFAAERQCKLTNDRLSVFLDFPNGPMSTQENRILGFLKSVKTSIGKLLGRLPDDLVSARHGPGATYLDRGAFTTVPHKMSSQPTVTHDAAALLPFWEETAWFRSLAHEFPDRSEPLRVRGNRFTSVPKDGTTERGIAIEPSLNVYFQLGVGRCLRSRLKRVGIDLDDGQSLHRRVACEASRSKNGHLATIDLSSASDTVCKNLVRLLVPGSWLDLLETLRSPTTVVDGKTHHLQKFSSMGNGFTFELETLLFYSISAQAMIEQGVQPQAGVNLLVYGDDIIVPTECAEGVLSALRYLGFTPNLRKTYVRGLFRESCGGDYFDGVPVRGHYLKEFPREPSDWISLANGLRRTFESFGGEIAFRCFGARAWSRALGNLPTRIRNLRGPSALGDIVIHDVSSTWRPKWRYGIRYFPSWVPITQGIPLTRFRPEVQLASALYGVPSTGPFQRGRVSGYRIRDIPYS